MAIFASLSSLAVIRYEILEVTRFFLVQELMPLLFGDRAPGSVAT